MFVRHEDGYSGEVGTGGRGRCIFFFMEGLLYMQMNIAITGGVVVLARYVDMHVCRHIIIII